MIMSLIVLTVCGDVSFSKEYGSLSGLPQKLSSKCNIIILENIDRNKKMLHLKYYDVGYVAVEGVSARKSVFLEFILLYQKLKKRFWAVCLVET